MQLETLTREDLLLRLGYSVGLLTAMRDNFMPDTTMHTRVVEGIQFLTQNGSSTNEQAG